MEKHYKIRLPPQQVQLQSIYRCLTIWALNCRHLEFLSIADREWDRDVPALVRDAARSTVRHPVALRWQGQPLCHYSDRKLAGGCTEPCSTWASLSCEVFVPVVKNLSTASSPLPKCFPEGRPSTPVGLLLMGTAYSSFFASSFSDLCNQDLGHRHLVPPL